jgi:two-component system, OmpR family, sensor histidine kinase KdpD
MSDDRAHSFLQMIRRSQRGRLKIYLGFAPGVGKTFQMLTEGHRLKAEGIDAVIGVVEHHGREETRRLIDGLERVPMRQVEYHGIRVEEMDVDAILVRKPQVCLVDELAHTNIPGSRNGKRYEDVQDLLVAGIHVITTLNVQHLESLYDTVERLVGVRVRERLPDSVLADADEVVNVDLAADDLQKRLREGKIYPRERVASSLDNFFTASNLEHLRELTLRELASQIDFKRRENRADADGKESRSDEQNGAPDQVMVCLSSRGPNCARLLRYGSRLAGRLNRNWYAVYVQTPREEPTVIDATTQRILADTLTLANQLGATVFTFKGTDVSDTILRFAKEYRCGNIVIGSPHPIPLWRRLVGERSVAEQLIVRQRDVTVIVVDADAKDTGTSTEAESRDSAAEKNAVRPQSPAGTGQVTINSLLNEDRVVIVEDPVTKSQTIKLLVEQIARHCQPLDTSEVIRLVEERESRGSTFLNEGVALPHARVPGLPQPLAALAITHSGILDAQTDRQITAVFLLLTPAGGNHLPALAVAGRFLNDRIVRQQLAAALDPAAAMKVIQGG